MARLPSERVAGRVLRAPVERRPAQQAQATLEVSSARGARRAARSPVVRGARRAAAGSQTLVFRGTGVPRPAAAHQGAAARQEMAVKPEMLERAPAAMTAPPAAAELVVHARGGWVWHHTPSTPGTSSGLDVKNLSELAARDTATAPPARAPAERALRSPLPRAPLASSRPPPALETRSPLRAPAAARRRRCA
jgi:hypothetical protein